MSAATGQTHYFGETSALGISKILTSVLRSVRLQGPGMTVSGVRSEVWRFLPRPLPATLPEQDHGTMLAESYFRHVHPLYPFLHRPTFNQWMSHVYQATSAGTEPDPVRAFFVYAVCLRMNTS